MEPEISPLAKRLAESNNVDWRALRGSGSNGRIIEKDVLDHLAAVMMGDEELNPTAEPLPEGMEAWPEADVASYRTPSAHAASSPLNDADDGFLLDTDEPDEGSGSFGTLDRPSAGSSGGVYDAGLGGAGLSGEGSDDLFALEDELGAGGDPAFKDPAFKDSAFKDPAFEDDAFYGLVFADEPEAASDSFGLELDAGRSDPGGAPENALLDAADLEIGGFSDGSGEERHDGLTFAENAALEASAWDEGEPELLLDDDPVPPYAKELEVALFDEGVAEARVVEAREESSDEPADGPSDAFADGVLSEASSGDADEAPDARALDGSTDLPTGALERDSLVGAAGADSRLGVYDAQPQRAESSRGQSENSADEPELVALGAATAPSPALPLVSYGLLLRRHLDLHDLMDAQQALEREMGGAASLGLLLARAAAKALQSAPLGAGGEGVALARLESDAVKLVALPNAAQRSLRELIEGGAASEAAGGAPALAVVDLSDAGVDEAVLNLGCPVLTLGRVLYDSEAGGHHSTLSLSGEVGLERGARLLAAVAELLASPVRLVV